MPNSSRLKAIPHNRAGEFALRIYEAALRSVRADSLVNAAVSLDADTLRIQGDSYDLAAFRRILLLGAGKASAGMAAALETILGDRIDEGVVVTKHAHSVPTRTIVVLEASHPLPGDDSIEAGRRIVSLAESAGKNDLLIALLSGGASALMELPSKDISLENLRYVTDLLQRAGADIHQLNAVRRRLSRIKAGGLARAAGKASLICLVISDVRGNDLATIGSGPFVTSRDPRNSALEVIDRFRLRSRLPERVMASLSADSDAYTPSNSARHYIIGDVHSAVSAAATEAQSLGLRPLVLTRNLEGEASAVARTIPPALPIGGGFDCLIAGGETTVTVRGDGTGGRAQEFAAAASELLPNGSSLICAGTDGTDGPRADK